MCHCPFLGGPKALRPRLAVGLPFRSEGFSAYKVHCYAFEAASPLSNYITSPLSNYIDSGTFCGRYAIETVGQRPTRIIERRDLPLEPTLRPVPLRASRRWNSTMFLNHSAQ